MNTVSAIIIILVAFGAIRMLFPTVETPEVKKVEGRVRRDRLGRFTESRRQLFYSELKLQGGENA